ncbi:MAG: LysR family transcriptional regulator [Thermodesulfobacteriota bacterium]
MNCDQLRTFQAVATSGSFTKAARRLFLTQPAVSQQIQSLEASLGVRLFDRSSKKIHLTREGEMLLARTSKVTAEFQKIESLFEELSNLNKGKLKIGSSAVLGTYFLPCPIGKFNSEYPCIEINLHAGNSHKVISMLLNNKIEFGFGGLVENDPKIGYTMIHQERFVAVMGSQHPLTDKKTVITKSLKTVPFILREKGTRIRRDVDDWLTSVADSFSPECFIELENVETAKRLVEEGHGITIVPRVAVQRELDSGLLRAVELPNLDLNASYYLYYPKHRKFSRAARTFLALLPQTVSLTHSENLDTVPM